jgi:predicted transcriptional regulator
MDSVFEIIAEPNRRAILSLLLSSQQSVGEIERELRMPQPTVSKHKEVRYLEIHEDDQLDEQQMASWIKQAASIPGWDGGSPL